MIKLLCQIGWVCATLTAAAGTGFAATNAPVALRGYGSVRADFGADFASFACQDAKRADMVLGKMLADLFWDANGASSERKIVVDGVPVVVRSWAPYGEIAAGRVGSRVVAIGASDDAELATRLRSHPDFLHSSPSFSPGQPYPRYLDNFDLRAYKTYTAAMASPHDLGLDSHWPFIKKFGIGGIAFQALSLSRQCPAPGVASFTQSDYEMRVANQEGGVASIALGCGGEVPVWVQNGAPDGMMTPSPTSQLGTWTGPGSSGARYESWWLPESVRANTTRLFQRQAMERYVDNPALSSWLLYNGAPGAEIGFHGLTGLMWDYSRVGEEAFRSWLQTDRKLTLSQLGERWYGDPNHFASWDQVSVPDGNAFFGGCDPSSRRIATGWQWASAKYGVMTPPAAGDPAWVPVAMPPSQQQALLPWGESFFRVSFDGSDWAARPSVWLACNVLASSRNPTVVWLNGEKIASAPSNKLPFAISIAGKVKPGANELVVRVPRGSAETQDARIYTEGKMVGPIFLTAVEPNLYPYMDERANARFVDLRDWQAAGVASMHRGMLDMALAIDPDHPFVLSGAAVEGCDQIAGLADDYGASCQHTGREAWYHPYWAGLGLIGGFYGTSEESAVTKDLSLTRELGWMMMDGDSSHNLFNGIEEYQLEEQRSGWFTRHKRAIECFGKYLRVMPRIAVLRSGRDLLLGSPEPWKTDIGTGELQAIHLDNAYSTEAELARGLTDVCPVLWDAGTEIMDDSLIESLRGYIERGGTFIAVESTGRHSSIKQYAYPLARLTGLVESNQPQGQLTFSQDAPLMASWAGRSFAGAGVAFTPAPSDIAVPGGRPLAIARWADGSIAIAERQIGKGRIIQIGAPFWRDHGPIEAEFLSGLFTELGVTRNADSPDPRIWARKAITKNGLQDWLVTFNNSDSARAAAVSMAVEEKPAKVWDLLAGDSVEFTYANGFVTIPNVSYDVHAVRLFAAKRADLAGGLPFWWAEKVKYWKTPPAASSPAVLADCKLLATPASTNDATIPFAHWRFLADRDGSAAKSGDWTLAGYDDSAWGQIDNGPWNMIDPALTGYEGVSLYRRSFVTPDSWKGRRVDLRLFDWDRPIVYDQGSFYINGTKVADYQAHAWSQQYSYDVTGLLRPGRNEIAVSVQGGKQFSGICGSVWLEPEVRLSPEIDLGGTWQTVASDFKTRTAAQLPGKASGLYIEREFDVPSSWIGKTDYLHIDTGLQWIACIVINGHSLMSNGSMHPFTPRLDLNISPFLVVGRNVIEIWPYTTIPTEFALENKPSASMTVDAVSLGVAP